MSAISERLNVNSQYAGTYRRRLIEAEIIESAGYGKVDFELPYMRDFYARKLPTKYLEITLKNRDSAMEMIYFGKCISCFSMELQ